MKKWIAMILVLCMVTPFAALGEAAVEAAAETAEETKEYTLYDVRYYYEHKLLPQLFYEIPEDVLVYMQDGKAFDLWKSLTEDVNFPLTFTADQFILRDYPQEDGGTLLQLELPKPEDTALCFRVYFYRNALGVNNYFTVEYDNYFGEAAYLCGWTAEGNHLNFGTTDILEPDDPDYETKLAKEATQITQMVN